MRNSNIRYIQIPVFGYQNYLRPHKNYGLVTYSFQENKRWEIRKRISDLQHSDITTWIPPLQTSAQSHRLEIYNVYAYKIKMAQPCSTIFTFRDTALLSLLPTLIKCSVESVFLYPWFVRRRAQKNRPNCTMLSSSEYFVAEVQRGHCFVAGGCCMIAKCHGRFTITFLLLITTIVCSVTWCLY